MQKQRGRIEDCRARRVAKTGRSLHVPKHDFIRSANYPSLFRLAFVIISDFFRDRECYSMKNFPFKSSFIANKTS